MDKFKIKQILLDQKNELDVLFKKNIIDRNVVTFNAIDMESDLIKVVIGIRRCGKSVFTHLMLKNKNYGYVNFDDERFIGLESKDLNDIYQSLIQLNPGVKILVLDELQNVQGWELFVNRLKRKDLQIIITGSNSNLLSQELSTHITGRYISYELFPFSFKEFLRYLGKDFKIETLTTESRAQLLALLEKYIEYGGFPEAINLSSPYLYLRELYDKLITRDIVTRYSVQNVTKLKEIALYLLSNFGNLFTYNRIKNLYDMKSVHTVQNYVDYLERVYLIFQLQVFSNKISEISRHSKKTYAIDTGMINALVPKLTIDSGRMMENVVFLECKRRGKDIFFYDTSSGEVDFIVRDKKQIIELIQVSFNTDNPLTLKREIKSLLKACSEFNCSMLTIITWDYEGEIKQDSKVIRQIPLWKWLLQ